jgi:hypothetical protein
MRTTPPETFEELAAAYGEIEFNEDRHLVTQWALRLSREGRLSPEQQKKTIGLVREWMDKKLPYRVPPPPPPPPVAIPQTFEELLSLVRESATLSRDALGDGFLMSRFAQVIQAADDGVKSVAMTPEQRIQIREEIAAAREIIRNVKT